MILPGMFCIGQFNLLMRYLATMFITFEPMMAHLIAAFLHAPLCYVFTIWYDMGIKGLGLATSITNFTALLLIMIYLNSQVKIILI